MTKGYVGWFVIIVMSLAICGEPYAYAQPPAVREYQVKAAFVYNFAKFVEWPAAVFANAQAPLRLCIVGEDPFGEALDALKDKTVRDRRLGVQQLARVESPAVCQIAFISTSEKERLPQLLEPLKDTPVLTVSDMDSFLHAGGVINLVTVDNKIGFEINLDAARRAGLTISAQLLKLATAVNGKP
jgi:hypothetical protein